MGNDGQSWNDSCVRCYSMEPAWIAKLARHAISIGGLVNNGWPTDVTFSDGQIHLSGE